MNPRNLRIRTDRTNGDLWLTLERHAQPPQRLKNITNDVLLNLCADLTSDDGATAQLVREVRFSDGMVCRVTVEMINPASAEPDNQNKPRTDRA